MAEVIERSPADVERSVRNILADLRSDRISGAVAEEIGEAVVRRQHELDLEPRWPWSVMVIGALIAVGLILWCFGIV